jgi:hypothetical protein
VEDIANNWAEYGDERSAARSDDRRTTAASTNGDAMQREEDEKKGTEDKVSLTSQQKTHVKSPCRRDKKANGQKVVAKAVSASDIHIW